MNTYKHHRFPPDIISYAVWLYYRFNLSHRDIEDLFAERGITVTYEISGKVRLQNGVGQWLEASSSEFFAPDS
jgi:transposase-like protein